MTGTFKSRLFSILMAVVLVVGLLPTFAFAQDPLTADAQNQAITTAVADGDETQDTTGETGVLPDGGSDAAALATQADGGANAGNAAVTEGENGEEAQLQDADAASEDVADADSANLLAGTALTTASTDDTTITTADSGAYVGWHGAGVNTSRGSPVYSLYVAPYQDYVQYANNEGELLKASEVAYCYNEYRQWPLNLSNGTYDNSSYSYIRYNKTSNVDGATFLNSTTQKGWTYNGMTAGAAAGGPKYTDGDTLKKHVLSIALNGYPQDYSGYQKKYGLSDDAFRTLTQRAIWNATDSYDFTESAKNWSWAENQVYDLLVANVLPDSVLNAADTGKEGSVLDLYLWDGNGYDGLAGANSSDDNAVSGHGYQNLLAVSTASISDEIGPRSLTITKKVDGTDVQKADYYEFSVNVSFDGAQSGDTNYWYVASNGATVQETSAGSGVYTVTLTNDGKVEFFAANPTFSYTVEETTPTNGLTPEVTVTGGGNVDATNSGKVSGTGITEDVTLAYTNYDTSTYKDVKISKQDVSGHEIEGAKMQLLDSTGKEIDSWTSGSAAHESVVTKGTDDGAAKYTLHEEAAPEGYKVATDISFTVDKDGNITVGDKTLESDAPIVMTDAAQDSYKVKVSKQDVSGAELAGAHLQIVNSTTNATKAEWDSDGNAKEVELYPGSYVLKETAAPSGYDLATTIAFTVSEEGTVTVGDKTLESNAPIVMVDNLGTVDVKLSKQDVSGNEVEGAKMQLLDANGGVLKEWTSGTQAEEFTVNKGTEAGNAKYTLHEEAAPEGYLVATDITFEADSQGNITRTDATTVTDATIVMVDNAASKHGVSVSKQDVAGAELAGATLQIENANTGEVKDSWESDGAVHTVQLFPGAYKLVEKAAPEGYSLATAIAFTVGEDGVITVGETTLESNAPIVMVDAVADTPSTQDNPNNPVNPDTPDNPNTPNDEGSNLDNQNNSDNQGGNEDSSTADESDGSDVLADTGDSLLPVGLVVLVAVVGLGVLVIARLRSRSNK